MHIFHRHGAGLSLQKINMFLQHDHSQTPSPNKQNTRYRICFIVRTKLCKIILSQNTKNDLLSQLLLRHKKSPPTLALHMFSVWATIVLTLRWLCETGSCFLEYCYCHRRLYGILYSLYMHVKICRCRRRKTQPNSLMSTQPIIMYLVICCLIIYKWLNSLASLQII